MFDSMTAKHTSLTHIIKKYFWILYDLKKNLLLRYQDERLISLLQKISPFKCTVQFILIIYKSFLKIEFVYIISAGCVYMCAYYIINTLVQI